MKIKVIDLLNMISKGEEVPKKIKFDYQEYEYNDLAKTYYCGMNTLLSNYKFVILNDEVEIIEEEKKPVISKLYINNELQYDLEEKKIPEKLEDYSLDKKGKYPIRPTIYEGILKDKINSIIDYLKSKGE